MCCERNEEDFAVLRQTRVSGESGSSADRRDTLDPEDIDFDTTFWLQRFSSRTHTSSRGTPQKFQGRKNLNHFIEEKEHNNIMYSTGAYSVFCGATVCIYIILYSFRRYFVVFSTVAVSGTLGDSNRYIRDRSSSGDHRNGFVLFWNRELN